MKSKKTEYTGTADLNMANIALVSFWTIVHKEVIRFLRIWTQTLLPPVITVSLYFLIFGAFIGSQIPDIEGISYVAFIVPGLLMMTVINSSYMNVVSSFFFAKFIRYIEEFLVSPTPNWVILAGYIIGGALRGLLVGLIVYVVSIFFTQPQIFNFWIVLLFIIMTSIVFALGGFLNAIFATKFDDINIFPTFVLTPLTYLGGVFYSVKMLPEFWQQVSLLNPILYMINGFRYGFYGISDVNVWLSFGILALFMLVLGGLSLHLLNKGTGIRK